MAHQADLVLTCHLLRGVSWAGSDEGRISSCCSQGGGATAAAADQGDGIARLTARLSGVPAGSTCWSMPVQP
ncbi:hypothetical protein [Streptomyces sp. NPDC056683]|uniref:hypothetical protein n=1 Tax=Streptomyces sp. NPDC056683 TaxID=3345910 RepID=UPI00368D8A8D